KVIVASSAAALVSDRAYRPTLPNTSTTIFKKNDSFLTKPCGTRLCGSKILFSPHPPPCGFTISPLLLHNRPI
ncbi:hypothetical protein, partial [Sinorhizobium mexicanum]|uniref:hypothetical protein n=1 Tax=Sinorhizobium mexicanum TaxID=375549 RepID=UPI001AE9014F